MIRTIDFLRRVFFTDLLLKFASVAIAFGLWFFVNAAEKDSESIFPVGVSLRNVPDHLILVGPPVDSIDLRVSGPHALLSSIDAATLGITLDVGRVRRAGVSTFRIRENELDLPRGVTVVRMSPSEITVEFARLARKEVPVVLAVDRKPPGDLRIEQNKVSPEKVEIVGPAREIEEIEVIKTEALDLSNAAAGVFSRDVAILLPSEFLSTTMPTVKVHLRLAEPTEEKALVDLPVLAYDSIGPVKISPPHVAIRVRGPRSKILSLELPEGAVYVDASEYEIGEHRVVPAVRLPAEIEMIEPPSAVALQILQAQPTPLMTAIEEAPTSEERPQGGD